MLTKELIKPQSIAVIGASNDIAKPGGRVLKNLLSGSFKGKLYPVNPKEKEILGLNCHNSLDGLGQIDLAIIALASKLIPETMRQLASKNGTKAFIVLSAGFSEIGEEGKILEQEIVEIAEKYGASLIGPNCIGVMTPFYTGVFAGPTPELRSDGFDFVSGSGATACFILETAIPMGLVFSSVFSVGNSASIGVEEVLEHWDTTFENEESSKLKLIYIEQVAKPEKFLKHTKSLIKKGCKIAAIKSGTTEAGSRAASSHTGALAGSDTAVDALMRKAGIIRCSGRLELAYIAGILAHNTPQGKNFAVITHAGGPGVMLTDELARNGLKVPKIEGEKAVELLSKLHHGSSVSNPIDFLATGNALQLGEILEYTEKHFENIDASCVIFGTPGLFDVSDVYTMLDEKMKKSSKPIYPILPSILLAKHAVEGFRDKGRIFFQDEVMFAKALSKVVNTNLPFEDSEEYFDIKSDTISNIFSSAENGYLEPESVDAVLDTCGIPRVGSFIAYSKEEAVKKAKEAGFPIVLKAIGLLHKSDAGGVKLGIEDSETVEKTFQELMTLRGVSGVLIQPMISGIEIFVGVKKEEPFGHLILCGLGGIFIEIFKDTTSGLAPIGKEEAMKMIQSLKSYKILEGARGNQGIDIENFAEIITRVSLLAQKHPEIAEMDINPLIGTSSGIFAVDARLKIEKLY